MPQCISNRPVQHIPERKFGAFFSVYKNNRMGVLQQIRQNPLYYPNVEPERLQAMQAQLAQVDIAALLALFPPAWLPQWAEQVTLLQARLSRDWQDETRYLPLLEQLPALTAETEEARKARALKNREVFEQRFKTTLPR